MHRIHGPHWFLYQTPAPPAASLAFTSRDGVVVEAKKLFEEGRFKAAETLLTRKDKKADADALRARKEGSM